MATKDLARVPFRMEWDHLARFFLFDVPVLFPAIVLAERWLIAGDCNAPNALFIPFSLALTASC